MNPVPQTLRSSSSSSSQTTIYGENERKAATSSMQIKQTISYHYPVGTTITTQKKRTQRRPTGSIGSDFAVASLLYEATTSFYEGTEGRRKEMFQLKTN
mmetsp:Transcript_23705/g.56032  ORF Transcript_23705/g.56032 Transcript_23705/m.56032 type:complete len:99 (+) Transcript_23705:309-605(+)